MKVCVAQVMFLDVGTKSLDRAIGQIRVRLAESFKEDAWMAITVDRGTSKERKAVGQVRRPRLQLLGFGPHSIAKCYKDGVPMSRGVRVRVRGELR